MRFYTTNFKNEEIIKEVCDIPFVFDQDGVENEVVNLYPQVKFETFEGFGGAITDSAAYVYSLMNESQKKELIKNYFSKAEMGYRMTRIHMDSCDFSVEMYEAMSNPDDKELKSFSFDRTLKYIIPMLEDAKKEYGDDLKIMLSPWSPPAFMKDNGSRTKGGKLKKEYREFWANYICRYIKEFKDRGYVVNRISVQNEPKAVQSWDSCIYTAEEEKIFLRDFLYPVMQKNGYEDIEIFIWDHNKERVFERACAVIDESTKDIVKGIAFHWYSGDHFEALDLVRKTFPDKKLMISESCIEYSKFGAGEDLKNAQRLAHEIIGDLNHGMSGFYDWNLLLDENGGPNHVGNFCHAPFLFNKNKNELQKQLIAYYFYHFSHYIKEGARRIAFSKYREDIDMTAFENPDKSIVFIALNKTDHDIKVHIRKGEDILILTLKANSITSGVEE